MTRRIITRNDWVALRKYATYRSSHKGPMGYEGCQPRLPYGGMPRNVLPWPAEWTIPARADWPAMIKERQGKMLASLTRGKIGVHDQGSTSRCWVHGSVRAVELLRIYEGQSPLMLSPDSVAYPIEGTRDRGGYPEHACEQLAIGGACPQSAWPESELAPTNADKDWEEKALNHVLLRWIEIKTWDQQIYCGLNSIPVSIGLGWWGHLVCQVEPVVLGKSDVGIDFDNSWGNDWGYNGSGILDEESGTADLGAFAPISETFSS